MAAGHPPEVKRVGRDKRMAAEFWVAERAVEEQAVGQMRQGQKRLHRVGSRPQLGDKRRSGRGVVVASG
jgi:hypothetical protein